MKPTGQHIQTTGGSMLVYARDCYYEESRKVCASQFNNPKPYTNPNQKAPDYTSKLLKPYMPRVLRSSEHFLLEEPSANLKTYGFRSFSVAAPNLWNSIPRSMRPPMSLESFKAKLKTRLMKAAYP